MTETIHLALPYIDAAQAQKHVTHNEALQILDALIQLSVIARDELAPPSSPAEGDRYIVGAGATGAFAGKDGRLAAWLAGGWMFLSPRAGWIAHVESEALTLIHDGTTWRALGSALGSVQNLDLLGVGTAADSGNPFTAKLNAAAFAGRTLGEGGSGDLRVKLVKEAAGDTASQLFQTSWSGRAEIGLIGDDDLRVKVSADGATWKEAMVVDRGTGEARFPFTAGCKITVFSSSGTWTRDARTVFADVILWGAGGGGGSGARTAAGTASSGGGGGGAGFLQRARYTAAQIGASQTMTIAAGGAGGAPQTADNSAGSSGGNGGNSQFGSLLQARGGGGGAGGGLGIGSGGGSSAGMITPAAAGSGATGGAAPVGGAAGGSAAVGADNTASGGGSGGGGGANGGAGWRSGYALHGSSGGGAGGGISAGGTAAAGGLGYFSLRSGGAAAASPGGSPGQNGGAGDNKSLTTGPIDDGGTGGGGGGAHAITPGAGGTGGVGAGGGGGGASQNGAASGAGGAGGPGQAVVIEYF